MHRHNVFDVFLLADNVSFFVISAVYIITRFKFFLHDDFSSFFRFLLYLFDEVTSTTSLSVRINFHTSFLIQFNRGAQAQRWIDRLVVL